jgi:hypothetical protein
MKKTFGMSFSFAFVAVMVALLGAQPEAEARWGCHGRRKACGRHRHVVNCGCHGGQAVSPEAEMPEEPEVPQSIGDDLSDVPDSGQGPLTAPTVVTEAKENTAPPAPIKAN